MLTRAKRRARGDDGSILVMALILVVIFGVLVGSIATYAAVSFRHTRVVRSQTAMRASAEAGLRITLDQLKRHQTLCNDFGSTPQPLLAKPNDATVVVQCTNIGGANQGASNWAVILTGIGAGTIPSLFDSGTASDTPRRISGSLYMAVPSSNDVKRVELTGDLWYPNGTCAGTPVAPTIPGLTIMESPPNTKICTTTPWNALVPTIFLPAKPAVNDPAGRDDLVAGCRIFFPGTYTSPPSLGAQNYFVSGDYYFEFDDEFEIKNATVIGGNIDPTLGDTQYVSAPNCANARAVTAVGGAEQGYGNTWFMGRGAWVDITGNGKLELFRRLQGTQAVSLMTIGTSGAGYLASTNLLADGEAILSTKSGSNNDMVIHGLINAPKSQVEFGNVSNDANAQVLGGVVAAGIDMQASASASAFVIATATIPSQTKILMRSTATEDGGVGSAVVQAVIDYQPSRFVLDGNVSGTTVTSATANFTADDVGNVISGAGILGGTKIASVVDATTVTLSVAPTASATGTRLVIETPQIAINSWRKV
jgi:hypothetical protein